MPNIIVDGVCVDYPIYQVSSKSLKITALNQFVGSKISRQEKIIKVQSLVDVNLAFHKGDRVGLIGHNGSGKSTLLRVLAGVAHPQKGRVDIQGRVVPLIEKGLGIDPELTGRANIELPLRLLGASTEEVRHAKEEIPEWTGLGDFIDLPVRTYSEGMRSRLTFAISTSLMADVLLLDEWLGTGDARFIKQANARLDSLLEKAGIVVIASHANEIIRNFCNKVVWMERGEVVDVGDPERVVTAYEEAKLREANQYAMSLEAPPQQDEQPAEEALIDTAPVPAALPEPEPEISVEARNPAPVETDVTEPVAAVSRESEHQITPDFSIFNNLATLTRPNHTIAVRNLRRLRPVDTWNVPPAQFRPSELEVFSWRSTGGELFIGQSEISQNDGAAWVLADMFLSKRFAFVTNVLLSYYRRSAKPVLRPKRSVPIAPIAQPQVHKVQPVPKSEGVAPPAIESTENVQQVGAPQTNEPTSGSGTPTQPPGQQEQIAAISNPDQAEGVPAKEVLPTEPAQPVETAAVETAAPVDEPSVAPDAQHADNLETQRDAAVQSDAPMISSAVQPALEVSESENQTADQPSAPQASQIEPHAVNEARADPIANMDQPAEAAEPGSDDPVEQPVLTESVDAQAAHPDETANVPQHDAKSLEAEAEAEAEAEVEMVVPQSDDSDRIAQMREGSEEQEIPDSPETGHDALVQNDETAAIVPGHELPGPELSPEPEDLVEPVQAETIAEDSTSLAPIASVPAMDMSEAADGVAQTTAQHDASADSGEGNVHIDGEVQEPVAPVPDQAETVKVLPQSDAETHLAESPQDHQTGPGIGMPAESAAQHNPDAVFPTIETPAASSEHLQEVSASDAVEAPGDHDDAAADQAVDDEQYLTSSPAPETMDEGPDDAIDGVDEEETDDTGLAHKHVYG